jgi:hypothetical protein
VADDRRFSDDEVAEILDLAAATEAPASAGAASRHGLTLSELKEIGSEVGIDPARIEAAARTVAEQRGTAPPARLLGTDRSVARTVSIDRPLTEDEWDRLVADLRETFGALGTLETHGSLRVWRNGNLQVHVEPYADAYRVRMRTVKGNAMPRLAIGGTFTLVGAMIVVVEALTGPDAGDLIFASLFAAIGLGNLGYLRWMLPRWVRERAEQMEGLAERIPRIMGRERRERTEGP